MHVETLRRPDQSTILLGTWQHRISSLHIIYENCENNEKIISFNYNIFNL